MKLRTLSRKSVFAVFMSQMLILQSLPAAGKALEEITVTARKRPETLMDAPIAVSAVSGEKMKNQGITNMEQISAQVPGLQIGRAAQTTNVAIRGIGSGINKGFEQSVGMYLDGVYQPRSRQFTQALVDVERIEVLRGPQGILFGKNTVAGAIKVETVSAAIGDEFEGYISAALEPDQSTSRYTAMLTGSMGDNFAARLVLRNSSTDGYIDNRTLNTDEQRRDDTLARLSMTWQPTDNLTVRGKISHVDTEANGMEIVITTADYSLIPLYAAGGRTSAVLGSIALSAGLIPFEVSEGSATYDTYTANPSWVPGGATADTELLNASLEIEWDAGSYALTSLTGYSTFDMVEFQDADMTPANIIQNTDAEELDFFSQEFRIATDWDGRVNAIAGVYYEDQDFFADTYTQIDGTLGGLAILLTGQQSLFGPIDDATRYHFFDQSTQTLAAFAEFSFELSDTLTLEVGARYSSDEKEMRKQVAVGTGSPGAANLLVFPEDTAGSASVAEYLANAAAASGVEGATAAGVMAQSLGTFITDTNLKRDETHVDPSVKLLWNYGDDGMAFISYSEGYKSGGFNYSPTTALPSGAPTPDAVFTDESVAAWELGLKQRFWGGRARGGVIVYRSDLEDLQVTAWNGTNFVVGNAAEVRVQGIELEGQFLLTESFEVGANINFLDHEFQSYPGAPCTVAELALDATCQKDLTGARGAFAPEFSAALFGDYVRDIGNWTFNMHVEANYKDEMFLDGDLDPNALQDSYTKVNANVGFGSQDGRWDIVLYGRNLTDENTYTASLDAPLGAGIYAAWIEEPRVWGLKVQFGF